MEETTTVSLSAAQRDLLLKYKTQFADDQLLRLISVALKKGDNYEICFDGYQAISLLNHIAVFLDNEKDEELESRLYDLGGYLVNIYDPEGDDDDCSEHSSNTGAVCILKVALADEKKIWRKIAIREGQTLHDLHYAIFEAFDRDDEHMYSFFFPHSKLRFNPRKIYRASDEYTHPYACEDRDMFDSDAQDASLSPILHLDLTEKQTFYYLFDFGDDWWHEIKVEKTDGQADDGEYPRIIEKNGESPEQYPDYDEDEED